MASCLKSLTNMDLNPYDPPREETECRAPRPSDWRRAKIWDVLWWVFALPAAAIFLLVAMLVLPFAPVWVLTSAGILFTLAGGVAWLYVVLRRRSGQ